MTRLLHGAAFAAGGLAIAWAGASSAASNPWALVLVLFIGACYAAGALELHRFRQATASLQQALAPTSAAPADLDAWLGALHPGLRGAVRLRVQGERVALPGPALTPYLAGLLVLLGMLGTFVGMVVTLKGTGLALENASDLEAIRASLAAPVKGLGLAFGTSVAGVAASAMLGLMSALARRERQGAARLLDTRVATTLRRFSRAHQREESQQLLRAQAEAMPALVTQLQSLVTQMERQGRALHEHLLASQKAFQAETRHAYVALADSVDRSLKTSLAESARLAGAAIEPAVQSTMSALARETTTLHQVLGAAVQQQLDGTTARLESTSATLAERWQTALGAQQRHGEAVTQGLQAGLDRFAQAFEQRTREAWAATLAGFEQQSAALLRHVADAHAAWDTTAAARERERMAAFHEALTAMTAAQQREVAGLLQAAAEAPRAAAAVVADLRHALGESLVRDNAALDERNRLIATLSTLLDAVNHASIEQRAAIDALVQTTSDVLARAGSRFSEAVEGESRTLQSAAAQVASGAAEVASLSEGFGAAVQLFGDASERMTAQLQRIEAALGHSLARSDEQLAYYVAQAREIVELTLASQKQIVDDLRQLATAPAAARTASAVPAPAHAA